MSHLFLKDDNYPGKYLSQVFSYCYLFTTPQFH